VSLVPKSKPSDPAPPIVPDIPTDLEAAYRAHGGWLLDFLRRRFGRETAEDLAQETYARIAGAKSGLRSPKALLAVTALNAARDLARRRTARPRLVGAEHIPADASYPPEQADAVTLKQLYLCLPHNLREVFLLSRLGGLTYEEIALQRGVSVKTIEGYMTKALAICAARLRA
jgi:RNA polymerase sigma-70 factor (ECF subfamily)